MKKLILIFLIILFPVMVWAQQCVESIELARLNPAIVGGSVPAGEASGCAAFTGDYCFDFEGAGAPASFSTSSGTPDYDYSTVGLSLEGSQCLELGAADGVIWDVSYNQSEIYVTFWFRMDNIVDEDEYTFFQVSLQASLIAKLWIDSVAGPVQRIGVYLDAWQRSNTLDIAANTTYKFKVYVKADSGANDAVITLWYWNVDTWTQLETDTGGTNDGNVDNISWSNSADTETMYIDMVKVDTSDIASPD